MHTLGPWNWEGSFNFTNGGYRVITNAAGPIAHVCTVAERKRNTPYDAADAERDDNARLIAASPDMFAALKEIDIICNETPGETRKRMGTRIGNIMTAARVAIAKAEGK